MACISLLIKIRKHIFIALHQAESWYELLCSARELEYRPIDQIKNMTKLVIFLIWRRGRDLNSRYHYWHGSFQDCYHQPLGHLSIVSR